MKTRSKQAIVLATWPHKTNTPSDQLGNGRDFGNLDDCDSFWLSLREVDLLDPDAYQSTESRLVHNIGIWVWFSITRDGTATGRRVLNIEVRLHDIHSMTLRECELTLKRFKALVKRMPATGDEADFGIAIQRVFAALGITHAIQYRGVGVTPTLAPIYEAVPIVVAEYDRRAARIQRKTA
jgi:hypothetical protein